MTPLRQARLRTLQGLAAAACVAVLLADSRKPAAPTELVLQPVAPPLTRIASLGDAPLLPEPVDGGPPPPAGAPPRPHPERPGPGPGPGSADLGHILRLQVEADAIALVELLGPERVQAAVAQRESMSALLGETRTWDDLIETLAARSARAEP